MKITLKILTKSSLLVAVIAVAAMGPANAQDVWHTETVTEDGRMPSIAIDSGGVPHISYYIRYDITDYHLMYAHHNGEEWILTAVDDEVQYSGTWSSLVLDGSDHPHISYYDLSNGDLRYAYHDGGTWHYEWTDYLSGDVGLYTSIALDDAGNPHISYYDRTNGDLKYAYRDYGTWHYWTVDATDDTGWWTSIDLDGSGYPHISYTDVTNYDLRYARYDGVSWHLEKVDSLGNVGLYSSLVLDGSDHPHISYYDLTNGDLKYARNDGASWHIEKVDSTDDVGRYTSIVLDGSGYPRISYQNGSHADLKYAYHDGTAWHNETVDADGNQGENTSIALDGDKPHIAYYNGNGHVVKHALLDLPTVCDISPGILDFGFVVVGSYRDHSSAISNNGGGFLTGYVREDCGDYHIVSGGGPFSVTAGNSRTVIVRFEPIPPGGTKICQVDVGNSGCISWYGELHTTGIWCTGIVFGGTAVMLSSYTVTARDGSVTLEWATGTEIDIAGFNIHRNISSDRDYSRINGLLIPTRGSEIEGASYSFIDGDVIDGATYYYWLEEVDLHGNGNKYGPVAVTVGSSEDIPTLFSLSQNFPNPFNPVTAIRYNLPEGCHVRLDVFDVTGREVVTLIDRYQEAGMKMVEWDGKNNSGITVTSGIYLYRLQAGSYAGIRKMVFMR